VPEWLFAAMPRLEPDNPNSCAHAAECQKTFDPVIRLESTQRIIDCNPSEVIDWIAPRPLMIIGNGGGPYDWIHPPKAIQEAFARAGEAKELVFLPYDAFGLYQEPGRGEAMRAAITFFDKHLWRPAHAAIVERPTRRAQARYAARPPSSTATPATSTPPSPAAAGCRALGSRSKVYELAKSGEFLVKVLRLGHI
jgi:hypothetical protein